MIRSNRSSLIFVLPVTVFIFFWGCDKIPGEIIETRDADESIVSINAPSLIQFTDEDSTFITTIELRETSYIDSMNVVILNSRGENELGRSFRFSDSGDPAFGDTLAGDGIYSAKPYMISAMANGNYILEYRKSTADVVNKRIAQVTVELDNRKQNYPPVISNLVMPETINRDVNFVIKLSVSDPNGLANLSMVAFKLTRPDGTQSIDGNSEYWFLVDNGDISIWGDEIRNDGIFSRKSIFPQSLQTGTWTFEFRAVDKANAVSNIITHYMVVE